MIFLKKVKEKEQNISIKISPFLEIELITSFDPGRSFSDVWKNADTATVIKGKKSIFYKVINYEDLISSKMRSACPKDLLDIQELKRLRQ